MTTTEQHAAAQHLGLQFRVKHPDGRSEQIVVDAERALIGSAAHCEVRLPPESAAREHVEVFASGKGQVHLAPRITESPPTLDGSPICVEGGWPSGAPLVIGGTTLFVETIDLGIRQRGRSPFWLFVPVAIIAAVVTILYIESPGPKEPPIPPPVALFDAPVTSCPMPASDLLPAFANEKLRLALTKRERGPFAASDAVDAVPLFEIAAACFHTAGLTDDEHEARNAGAAQRQKLDEEYHVRRVRLEHAFRIGDPFSARRELLVLVPMTSRRSGVYVEWLAAVDRQATLEVDQRTNRKSSL